jgi:hypothetical protein
MPKATAHKTSGAKDVAIRRDELPLAGRLLEVRDFKRAEATQDEKAPLASATLVLSAGAAVRRYDYYRERWYNEMLRVDESSVDMERLKRGAPLLNAHNARELEAVLGVLERPRVEAGRLLVDATFSRRPSVAGYVQDVDDGVIRNVSVGYVRQRVEMMPPEEEGGVWTYEVTRWAGYEGSLVPIPADMDAQVVRSADAQPANEKRDARTFTCEFVEITPTNRAAAQPPKGNTMTDAEIQAKRDADAAAARAATDAAAVAARTAEVARSAGITELCARHAVPQLAAAMIRDGKTIEDARAAVLEEIARRDAAAGGHRNTQIETVADEHETRMAGISEAIMSRCDPKAKLTDNGRQYRSLSLLEMGREHLEAHGVKTRGMDRMRLATEMIHFRAPGYHTTSDFANLLANVANKRLRNAYEENNATYQMWARRAPNAPDFKAMSVVQLGAAPDLLQTNEHGEFKYGGMTDGKETYSMLTYGRIVGLSRQAIVNDDLRGFDRLMTAFGDSAKRLENRTVYSILTTNAALADTGALFNATAVTTAGGHANLLSGGGSVLASAGLISARTAMRKQKGLQSEELNIVPATLIVPAALEQTAYQLTSSDFVPATTSAVNEFRRGGRTALEPVVEVLLDANSATAWYLAANPNSVDTIEYCYLDGAEGPVIESEVGFEVDGMSWKCRLDFAAKAIDFRGLLKSAGA